MSDAPETAPPPQAEATYRLRPAHGDQLGLITQLVLGARPVVLIHLTSDGDSTLKFDVDATGPSTREELASILEVLALVLRTGAAEADGAENEALNAQEPPS